jgi:Helix-turn-helix domain
VLRQRKPQEWKASIKDPNRVAVMSGDNIAMLFERLDRIEAALTVLVERQMVRDWYSTEEVARLLGRAEFTVREWCRLGRIHAEKKGSGRGRFQGWVVSHGEVLRIQREGLLPAR